MPPRVVELAVERSGAAPNSCLTSLRPPPRVTPTRCPRAWRRDDGPHRRAGPRRRRWYGGPRCSGLSFRPSHLWTYSPRYPTPDGRMWDRMSVVFARDAGGQVRFRRPALRRWRTRACPFKLRRELHLAVGLRLDASRSATRHRRRRAVESLALGRRLRSGSPLRDARRAARTERFSQADAVRLYRRAIDAGRALGPEADVRALAEAWEHLGDALRRVGEPAAGEPSLDAGASSIARRPDRPGSAVRPSGEVAERSEALSRAVRWLTRGLRVLETLDGAEARCESRASAFTPGWDPQSAGPLGRSRSALTHAIAEAEAVGELRALARACYGLDWALRESGHPATPHTRARALEIYQVLGDPEHAIGVLNNLGMFAYFDGRWDDAIVLHAGRGSAANVPDAGTSPTRLQHRRDTR